MKSLPLSRTPENTMQHHERIYGWRLAVAWVGILVFCVGFYATAILLLLTP